MEKDTADMGQKIDIKLRRYENHFIADEDSVQALLIGIAIIQELYHIHRVREVSIDDINVLWYQKNCEESEMIVCTTTRGGLLWSVQMQQLIDKTVKALGYAAGSEYKDGVMRVRELIWDVAQHIDDLDVDHVYRRSLYHIYSNLLGTYKNEMSPDYWRKGDKSQ